MKRRGNGKYLAEFVYGGIDGAVTTFAVVSGVLGASLSSTIVIILGFANLFADGFSMAVSNYLSTKSGNELDNHRREHRKEPRKTAVATFVSFMVIGFIPLISFVVAPVFSLSDEMKFGLSILLTAVALIIVGYVKGKVVRKSPAWAAAETLLIGGLAAGIAFVVGYLLRGMAT